MCDLATSCPELKLWAKRAKPYGLDPAPKGLRPLSAGTSAPCNLGPTTQVEPFYPITKDRMISAANIVAANIAIRFRSEYT